MGRPRVFLDSSVLITALLSAKGGSYALLQRGRKRISFMINEYVLEEVQDVLRRKFSRRPSLRTDFFFLLSLAGVEVLPSPPRSSLDRFMEVVDIGDVPILTSAVAACNYLATLDRDFLDVAEEIREEHGLIACTPGALLARLGM